SFFERDEIKETNNKTVVPRYKCRSKSKRSALSTSVDGSGYQSREELWFSNLSNRNLSQVPDEAVELQKLIIAHNNIESLKEELRNLPLLTVLNVSHNKLSELPAAIGELDCSNNQLKELPSSLGRCSDLSEFKASNNVIISLPEDLANCSKMMKLDVEGNKLTILSEKLIGSWTMLTELNASKNMLSGIPENIGSLSRLIRLDLHQNRLFFPCRDLYGEQCAVYITSGDGALSHLGTLDLHSNQLKEYPVEACKLRLSLLNLSNNSLSGLPPELGKMTTLRKLLLTGNPLRTLRRCRSYNYKKEDVIAMAARLSIASKELSMEGLGLTAVPSEVWESSEVTKVDLSRNSIQELPVELSSCVCLQTLVFSRNKIKDWPTAILRSLPNLLCLKLDNNPLRQIPPDGFQAAPMLQILDLSGNAASLPEHPSFSSLPHLQELYLSLQALRLDGNPLRRQDDYPAKTFAYRKSFTNSQKHLRSRLSENEDAEATTTKKEDVIAMAARLSIASKELSMEGLGLTAVPSEVWESSEVTKVDLSRNSIQELPVELSSCVCLQTLVFSRNKIKDWPTAILRSLPNLLCLKLDNNPLRQIPPDGFQAAPMLQILDLSGNAASLPEHPSFSSLPHLQELYLRRMQLREVPTDILSLQQLRILDLSQNSLQSVPVEFKNLTSLTELGLSDNDIPTLPPELKYSPVVVGSVPKKGLLEPSLQALRLDGNPLRSIRRTVLDRGTKAVLNYLKDKIVEA
ncbi:Leucine-rich repeat family protein, partial [Prunus dulcis]